MNEIKKISHKLKSEIVKGPFYGMPSQLPTKHTKIQFHYHLHYKLLTYNLLKSKYKNFEIYTNYQHSYL